MKWNILLEAPKYQTAYACEGKKLTIECEPGHFISLIRANYGRFSITICNDHGNVEWSVNCMFSKTLSVLNSRCANKQSCTVLATTAMFGDPCPGTHKYLEAHYQCVSAIQTTTTTHRPSPPPWVLNQPPPILPNIIGIHNSSYIKPGLLPPPIAPQRLPQPHNAGSGFSTWQNMPSSLIPPTAVPQVPESRPPHSVNINPPRHDGVPPPPPLQHHHHHNIHQTTNMNEQSAAPNPLDTPKTKTTAISPHLTSTPSNTRILTGVGGSGSDDNSLLTTKSIQNRFQQNSQLPTTLPTGTVPIPTESGIHHIYNGTGTTISRTVNNINNNLGAKDETSMFCGPINARNLFWNITRVGDVNVQPCPGGAAGIAKWRCVLMKRFTDLDEDLDVTTQKPCVNISCNTLNKFNRLRNFEPTWHPITPDLTQCRSLWLNSLEMRVNQRDSSLISIANDLSEVTSSKTLYGGDMLVTTKIIQTMSEKMFHDKETFPDQRQREAIILELLHGVVKTGSNLLDESQLPSWLDLNQEDQMRVATSLLTGLEYNAFLLADTIIREVNVVQKVKNILLSVRVLETKNIQNNVVFPDAEQWHISNDRIELPKASLMENSEGGLVRIVFAAFDRLESILKPTYDHYDLKSARSYVRNTALSNDTNDDNSSGEQRIRILNSKVISASLGKGRHIQLSQPIKLIFKHLKIENVTNPTCVFWNYIDHAWSANGCNLEATNRTHSICTCNHLTNFALLMDVVDEHSSSLFSMFDGNMRLLIYISIAICIIFIIIALLTLKIFNGVFTKNARTSIYRNIYICLFVIEWLFLFGIEQPDTSIFCGFNTTFLHCAVLAGIAWFCFEAFQTYTTLTTDDLLMEVDQTAKINCYYLLSYGLSLTVVAISLVIDPNSYTQNDYCVLMEAKIVFYGTFVGPVAIFLLGGITYTFISWIILCRRTRTTLKNKEHSRLSNIRFDTRCSFIFLLLFSAVWGSAYFYLRQSKADDEMATIYGYMFVGLNSLMGVYIFVFHCIQNEKIRREYRKYVRQNSWLPKCLRCSKTSISSAVVGGNAVINAGNAGTISSNATSNGGNSGTQLKKSKITDENIDGNENEDACTATADDAIIPSSDCELNEPQVQTKRPPLNPSLSQNLKSGILPGSLVIEHSNGNSDSTEGNIILARGSNTPTTTTTGTLRSLNGAGGRTPSAGHTSPTSSAGSTHLIFGHGHKQQMGGSNGSGGPIGPGIQAEAYYHQPDYYYKQPGAGGKGMPPMHLNYYGNTSSVSPSQHPNEFFYWTQKQHGKKKRGNMRPESPSGSLHSRTTASSQQMLFYPSYKKNPMKNQQQQQQQQQGYPHYSEAIEPNTYYQTQPHRRYPPPHQQTPHKFYNQHHHQNQQQLSSDEEQMDNAAHSRLLHLNRSRSGGGVGTMMGVPQIPIPPPPTQPYHPDYRGNNPHAQTPSQRYYRNKHSNCDVNQDYDGGRSLGGNSDSYYNHGSMGGDGPVYEEIMSNRSSDIHHYDVGDIDYNNERNYDVAKDNERAFNRNRNFINGSQRRNININQVDDDDDDETDDDDDDNCPALDDDDDDNDSNVLPQSDERMRRLMAMQDEDFKRRFQRQQRKKAAAVAALAANDAANYHEPYDPHQFQQAQPQQPQTPQQQSQQAQQSPKPLAVFGVSGGGVGGEGSVRSFKRSPSGRLAINEIFQIPSSSASALTTNNETKRQQQHQQSMSPQSTASSSSSSQQQPTLPIQQQQPRNISAMLDENNTVRCYLEPLAK